MIRIQEFLDKPEIKKDFITKGEFSRENILELKNGFFFWNKKGETLKEKEEREKKEKEEKEKEKEDKKKKSKKSKKKKKKKSKKKSKGKFKDNRSLLKYAKDQLIQSAQQTSLIQLSEHPSQ